MAKMSPLDIANLMGKAAMKKNAMPPGDDGDEDDAPMPGKSPKSSKSKQAAAIAEKSKGKGIMPPKPPMAK